MSSGRRYTSRMEICCYLPIVKLQQWEARLKNTRPITLLKTLWKCLVKILTNRLSTILYKYQVLKGGNYAGLPGGLYQLPIFTLDSILNDASINKKELWILSQDISKAFDSVSLDMLDLALARLKLPSLFIKFVCNLFSNRTNQVITHY